MTDIREHPDFRLEERRREAWARHIDEMARIAALPKPRFVVAARSKPHAPDAQWASEGARKNP